MTLQEIEAAIADAKLSPKEIKELTAMLTDMLTSYNDNKATEYFGEFLKKHNLKFIPIGYIHRADDHEYRVSEWYNESPKSLMEDIGLDTSNIPDEEWDRIAKVTNDYNKLVMDRDLKWSNGCYDSYELDPDENCYTCICVNEEGDCFEESGFMTDDLLDY